MVDMVRVLPSLVSSDLEFPMLMVFHDDVDRCRRPWYRFFHSQTGVPPCEALHQGGGGADRFPLAPVYQYKLGHFIYEYKKPEAY